MSTRTKPSSQDPRYLQLWLTFDYPKPPTASPSRAPTATGTGAAPAGRDRDAVPAMRRPGGAVRQGAAGTVERRQHRGPNPCPRASQRVGRSDSPSNQQKVTPSAPASCRSRHASRP